MKYLVKVNVDGKVETYTTEATDAAAAMFAAYDKYGVCGVMVSPVVQEAVPVAEVVAEGRYHLAIEWINDGAELCNEGDRLYRAPAPCPVDASIAKLDALLAERRAAQSDQLDDLAVQCGAASMVGPFTHPKGPRTSVKFKVSDGSLGRFAAALAARQSPTGGNPA